MFTALCDTWLGFCLLGNWIYLYEQVFLLLLLLFAMAYLLTLGVKKSWRQSLPLVFEVLSYSFAYAVMVIIAEAVLMPYRLNTTTEIAATVLVGLFFCLFLAFLSWPVLAARVYSHGDPHQKYTSASLNGVSAAELSETHV